jgi:glycosyltransferase involved in cell wall biosynthesis
MLLSVIVPIYGVEKYVDECVKSIINQTYKELEIILVIDGSCDRSPEICEYYKKNDSRVRLVYKKNAGLVSARKAGVEIAKGEYIGFVDGDDWIELQMYEDLINLVKKTDADIIVGGHKEEIDGVVVEVLKNSLPCGYYDKEKMIEKIYPYMLYTGEFSQFGIFSYLWNKIFRRDVIYDSQMSIDDRIFMAEDAACTYPALLNANSLYVTDSSYYHYRQHVNSMVKTREVDELELERYNLLYTHLYKNFINTPIADVLIKQLDMFLLSLLTVRSTIRFKNLNGINELFAFKEIPESSNVIVCGAGTFGQHLVRRIRNNQNFNLVLWADELYELFSNSLFPVKSYVDILENEYDYILVAFINQIHAERVKSDLLKLGVKAKRILLVSHFLNYPIKTLLKGFGLKLEE